MNQIGQALMNVGWLTAIVGVVPTVIALGAAWFTRVQANAARQQVKAANDQAQAAMDQVKLARDQLRVVASSAETTAKQAEAYTASQSATAWRNQIFDLHDRGLSPGQIRYIMHLEDGGAGYEGWNGRIDDIVANLPPSPSAAGTEASLPPVMSCDQMPYDRNSCTGPCQETARRSGCAAFRATDSWSPVDEA
jgi:hypothetical protein